MKLLPLREGAFKLYAICNEREDCPVLDFLDGVESTLLPQVDQIAVLWDRMKETGITKMSYSQRHQINKKHDLWELRTPKLRVVFFLDGRGTLVFTNGFPKKSQDIKSEMILPSINLKKRYLEEQAQGTLQYLRPLED